MENEIKKNNSEIPKRKNVETFTDDLIKVLENDKSGTIKKIIHEEEEREKRKKNLSPESAKNKIFMLVGIFLISLAVGALFSAIILKEKIFTAPVSLEFDPIIFTDKNFFAEIGDLQDKEKLASVVAGQVRASNVKEKGVEGIHLTENKNILNWSQFVNRIGASFPKDGLVKVNKDFLLGVAHTSLDEKNLFILFKSWSFADIFPHVKAWEPKMFVDLHEFFGIVLSAETSYLQTKEFEDGMVSNKNARILYGNDGEVVLMYVYADEGSVVITDSIPTAREIMIRLAGSKIKK